jgi:hypothetical protein
MTAIVALVVVLVLLFGAFHLVRYINRANLLLHASAVRRCSSADDRLFRDLAYGIGGIRFTGQLAHPDAKKRRVTSIEALQPDTGQGDGLERWTVAHETGSNRYLVTLRPDGAGGTMFAVEKES